MLANQFARPNVTVNRKGGGGGSGALNTAGFILPLNDLGSGVVNLVPDRAASPTPTFTRATDSWTNLSNGNIGLVASGSPRSYYSPGGVYLGYLAEGARTNLCQRGEDFTAVWADVGTPTVAAGTTIGALTLTTLGDDDASALEGKTQTITFTADAVKAIAVYVRQGTSTSSVIRVVDTTATADRLLAAITWSGAVPVVTMTTGTDLTGTPQQQGATGVYRLLFQTTAITAANTNSLQIYPATNAALATANVGTIQIGGVQAENATFPSSLIRTPASSTVTRNADVLTYPFAGNALATAGSSYAEVTTEWAQLSPSNGCVVGFVANAGPLMAFNTAMATAIGSFDGTTVCQKTGLTSMATAARKRAGSWGAAGQLVTGDGAACTTTAFDGDIGSTALAIGCGSGGGVNWFGAIKNVRLWLAQLSDAQLQAITS